MNPIDHTRLFDVPRTNLSRDTIVQRLARYHRTTPSGGDDALWELRSGKDELTAASVLVPIVNHDSGLTLLLTQRATHLTDHAGQISFPGGRREPKDASAQATALRETEEEIGLHRDRVDVLGVLPDYITGTGFQVTPVVGWVEPGFFLRADPFEVADVFEVPLDFLLDPNNHQLKNAVWQGHERQFYAMPYADRYIWGATAGMLRSLYNALATSTDT